MISQQFNFKKNHMTIFIIIPISIIQFLQTQSAFQMNLIKNFISSVIQLNEQYLIQKMFRQFDMNSKSALPQNYLQILSLSFKEANNKQKWMQAVINYCRQLQSPSAVLKYFTILLALVNEHKQNVELMEYLDQLGNPKIYKSNKSEYAWLDELTVCLMSYFMRFPSNLEVFSKASLKNNSQLISKMPPNELLQSLFRLTNQLSLLFPNLSNVANTMGRYYLKTELSYLELYKSLRLLMLENYEILKNICDCILRDYQTYDLELVECFINSINEMELVADKMEDFLMNKYFKGKHLHRKIYFKVEQIFEVKYYLERKKKEKKKEESFRTLDEEPQTSSDQ